MNITSTTDTRSSEIELKAKRELGMHVLSTRLDIKEIINRKCVYILNDLYNNRQSQHCVQTSHESWMVWNFDNLKHPKFDDNNLCLGHSFPIFANVYQVTVFRNSGQTFLKCDCHLYQCYGYPCSHILTITNTIETVMIRIQHWKIYGAYYGMESSPLSRTIMQVISLQHRYEGCGMPISLTCLETCLLLPIR